MVKQNGKRLINQAQFRNIGNYFDKWHVDRDINNLKGAVRILQDKLNDVNYKFKPKASKQAQDNFQKKGNMDDSAINDFMAKMGGASKEQVQDVINIVSNEYSVSPSENEASPHNQSANDKPAQGASAGQTHEDDGHHDDTSSSDDTSSDKDTASHGNDDGNPSADNDDAGQDNDADLNFLNRAPKH